MCFVSVVFVSVVVFGVVCVRVLVLLLLSLRWFRVFVCVRGFGSFRFVAVLFWLLLLLLLFKL